MDDLDYKDLFRDAIHTIAYIARAAGFDPNDPTVEPPAIVARIENQRAALKRLTTERAALLAPVEGVDLEEVLTATSWCSACDEPVPAEVAATHDACMDCGGDLQPPQAIKIGRLAHEVARLRDHVRRVEASEKARMVEAERLRAALEAARLTLAAEQGKPEGAPSADWTPQGGGWVNERLGRRVQRGVHGWDVFPLWPPFGCLLVAPTARAAMIAAMIVADAATGAR